MAILKMSLEAKFITALFSIIFVLYGIHLFLMTTLSIKGIELYGLEKQTKDLETQNMLLQAKLYQAQSFTTISQEAKTQGFIPVIKYFIVK